MRSSLKDPGAVRKGASAGTCVKSVGPSAKKFERGLVDRAMNLAMRLS